MCGKEYPVVNTEAVCLFSPTDFLWGPSQELVLESRRLLLPPRFSANTHLTSYILWLTISESCWTVTLVPESWPDFLPDSINVTYIYQKNGFWQSFRDFQDTTQRFKLEDFKTLRLPVAYRLPYLTFLTPTNQLFRKHSLLPRTDHKKNNTSEWIVWNFNSVMTENMIRAIWVDYRATHFHNKVLNDFRARQKP